MWIPSIILTAIALLGAIILLTGVVRLFRLQWMRAALMLVSGAVLMMLAVIGVGVMAMLYTYHVFTHSEPVASIKLVQQGPDTFVASVTLPDQPSTDYVLKGQEWMLSAKMLVWDGLPLWLGLQNQYQLERLSGEYAELNKARNMPRTVYDLAPAPMIDWIQVWQSLPWVNTWIQTVEGDAVYMPMRDQAQYQIVLTTNGLMALPLNTAAKAGGLHG